MTDLRKQLVSRHIGSKLSEFMLEMCPACTDGHTHADDGANWPIAASTIDWSSGAFPLVNQTCFEFLEVSYPGVVNLLL